MRRATSPAVLATLACCLAPAGAAAHVQVTPSVAAPDDAVLFEVLVPNEGEGHTTSVELKIPAGVIPFSFQATPGWKRKVKAAPDGSTDTVTWTGKLATDGFVRFAFLASTPAKEGTLSWKAIQRYDDGEVARWIGAPSAPQPAATTDVRRAAAARNAGGESGGGQPAGSHGGMAPAGAAGDSGSGDAGDDDRDPLALGLGGAGVVLGLAALTVALARRRRSD